MKTKIAALTAEAATYQTIAKSIVSFVIIGFVTQAEITVFDETSIIQTQLASVTKIYFQL